MIVLAFFCLYFFWGSTYLALRWAREGFPPFFLSGVRNLIAGLILHFLLNLRGVPRATAREWKISAIIGALLLVGGNGLVTFASGFLKSGIVAVLIAMLPMWMVILDRPRNAHGRRDPFNPVLLGGVLVGFGGVLILVIPKLREAFTHLGDHGAVMEGLAAAATVASSLCWACGSIYSARARQRGQITTGAFRMTGMQLMLGGTMLLVISLAAREHVSKVDVLASPYPLGSLAYLIVFGSLLGFTSYIWLLGVVPSSRISTYAYVNPIVAVLVGWLLAGETLTIWVAVAAAVIIASVAVIVSARSRAPAAGDDQARAQENGERAGGGDERGDGVEQDGGGAPVDDRARGDFSKVVDRLG